MINNKQHKPEILAKKLGMTHHITEDGDAIPVTVLELAENIVTEIKTEDKCGYTAIKYGAHVKKEKHVNKPQAGYLQKNNLPLFSILKEFRISAEETANYKVGEQVDVSKILVPDNKVDISGKSIGKGFQGMVKLHNISRGRKSHGSKSYRQPGSIGAGTYPGRVFPGKDMPSRMGNENITTRNLKVVEFIQDKNLILIKGSTPGVEGTYLTLKSSFKKRPVVSK